MRRRDSWPGELFLGGWRRVVMASATVLVLATGCAKSAGDWNQPPDPVDMASADPGQQADLSAAADLATGAVDLATGAVDQSLPGDLATPDLAKVTNCVIVPQSGCPAGLKCTTRDAKTTQCDPPGPDGRGQICTTTNDVDSCVTSTACIDEGMGKSQCRQFCRSDADCGARSYCMFNLDQAGNFKVCSQPCNAIYPGNAGCATGLGCCDGSPSCADGFICENMDCVPCGQAAGQPCCGEGSEDQCREGLLCNGQACEACGDIGLQCCANDTCPEEGNCMNGTCQGGAASTTAPAPTMGSGGLVLTAILLLGIGAFRTHRSKRSRNAIAD